MTTKETKKIKSAELSICSDCINYIANGELPEDKETTDSILHGEKRETENGGWIAFSGEELGFSNSTCDLCGGLPGDRYKAAVMWEYK